jgi:hypothetical protein
MRYVKSACVTRFCSGLKSRLIAWNGDIRQFTRLSDRLNPFSTEELSALLFSLDIAATVEPLTPEAENLRQEFIDELTERDPE